MALALNGLHEVIVPESWAETTENVIEAVTKETARKKYVFEIVNKTNAFEGDELSVQTLVDNGMTFGDEPLGTTASEKEGLLWKSQNGMLKHVFNVMNARSFVRTPLFVHFWLMKTNGTKHLKVFMLWITKDLMV